ncbi:MAG: hypothetical protein K5930_11045 [Treponemataceae bacterium]|nr:hypothetical protein [Treponemataceae bacterium]
MNKELKLLLHKYGAFTVILLALFFILATVTLLSKNTWENKLRESVSSVLVSKYGDLYSVDEYINIQTPAILSTAIYSITNKESNEKGKAILIRITGISGPTAAVYTYFDGFEKGSFAGYAANTLFLSGENGLDYSASETQINYYARRIPQLISKGIEKE